MERKCIHCGESFAPRHGHQKLCSEQCKAERARVLHRSASADYVRRHPDRRRATRAAYFQKVRADEERYARYLAQGRESYARHPETASIYAVAWRGSHREQVRLRNRQQQQERPRHLPVADESQRAAIKDYTRLLKNDPCVYCGDAASVIDHIDPISLGGRHHASNLAASCRRCNASKGNRPLLHFLLTRAEMRAQMAAKK